MSDVKIDPWARLRAATPARVALGRSGAALPLSASLSFQLDHARARDAVHRTADMPQIARDLAPLETIQVCSAAPDRTSYLRRPDLGRRLADRDWPALDIGTPPDVVIVIADGLSSDAVQTHAAGVAKAVIATMPQTRFGPVVLATQARVAIGDEIAHRLGARLVLVLVGERPGLTVADSLGAYLTFDPQPGRRDSERNCVSNIHGNGGLSHAAAAHKIAWLAQEGLRLGLTGTGLKENAGSADLQDGLAADALPVPGD